MTTFNFDFDFANTSCFPLESVKTENKEKAIMYYSKLYEKYSDRINKQNGKVLIGYSGDGTKIIVGQVECSIELFRLAPVFNPCWHSPHLT